MRKTVTVFTSFFLLVAGIAFAAGRDRFGTESLRGRYSGNLDISETILVDQNTTMHIDGRALLALVFDAKSGVTGVVSVSAVIPGDTPSVFTCVFDAQGGYEIAESGLGTATLNITPTSACAGPATLQLRLLVGGRNRTRLDVTIDGASGLGPGSVPIAIIGSGSLSQQ
jgi:hypothetical protein